jgi:hypothetical protein
MQQLEIEFFWPLTEQIPLDLDYTDCNKSQMWTTTTSDGALSFLANGVLMSTGSNLTWSTRLGNWEFPNETKQPSKFQKFMMKYFLGWKWMGK